MCINTSNTKVMSALVPGEQRQAVLRGRELLEDVDKFKYLGSMFIANGQGTEVITSRINFLVPHSLASNPVFGRSVKYCGVQSTGPNR